MKNQAFILLLFIGLTFSCSNNSDNDNEQLLAQVDDHVLYKKQVIDIMPPNTHGKDSITFIKTYVDNWVKTKVLYEKANSNISDNNGSIEEQVNRFREELYITKYEQLFSQQKLDTIISQTEIDNYYATHKQDFILRFDVVKPIFIVLPQKLVTSKIKKQFLSNNSDDLDVLKDFCFENSTKFYFGNQWVVLDFLKQEIPQNLIQSANIFESKGIILEDSANAYFIRIENHIETGKQKPKELAFEEIATVLLHKRKIDLLKSMRNKVYQDALHKKDFEVYY